MWRRRPKPAGYHWDRAEPVIHAGNGRKACRWCKGIVTPPKRNWCGDPHCLDEWRFRTDPAVFRSVILERDRGVCVVCRLDTTPLDTAGILQAIDATVNLLRTGDDPKRRAKRPAPAPHLVDPRGGIFPLEYWLARYEKALRWRVENNVPARESPWQIHHVVPIVDGGDFFARGNLWTVCVPCHRSLTVALNRRLAAERAEREGRVVKLVFEAVAATRKPRPVRRRPGR